MVPLNLQRVEDGAGNSNALRSGLTTNTDSLVGKASVMIYMIADDADFIPAQSTISMAFQ